ncbi:hypothetical protein A4X06_0g5655 [Tilletia controversa]|uniref:Uncharacterized protein n=3 Tax=Tilletia TaxID=13289 RepID=A0A8X7MQ26_9BASI|nr:hypothetical protein CF335_g3288 [Tilletia laevis]KAE8245504.1 hypothetical protein A4X06_0g5655 [Tilletia controversa]
MQNYVRRRSPQPRPPRLLRRSGFKVDPTVDVLRRSDESEPKFVARAEMERALGKQKKYEACKSLSSAGFLNLNLFGCGKFNVNPKLDIFRREGTYFTPSSAGFAHSSGTKHHPGTKGHPGSKGVHSKPGVHGAAGNCAVHISKSSCPDFSRAGLVNIDLLGCLDVYVSPTVKIGQGINDFFNNHH